MNSRGFTLIEVVVAVGILLLVGSVVAATLLGHLGKSRSSSLIENIHNIGTAITSAQVRGDLTDANGDGDYLDDLVRLGALDKDDVKIVGGNCTLKRVTDSGTDFLYLRIECQTDICTETLEEVDQEIDGGDGPDSGRVQWVS